MKKETKADISIISSVVLFLIVAPFVDGTIMMPVLGCVCIGMALNAFRIRLS